MPFHIIVATDQNRGIGQNGTMPWHIPQEIQHFSQLTKRTADPSKQNAVIMGRTTWESINPKFRPLPNRINIVLTKNQEFTLPAGVEKADSLDSALRIAKDKHAETTFVIGGSSVYEQAINHPQLESIYLTEIQSKFEADSHFPTIDPEKFTQHENSSLMHDAGYNFQYIQYLKKL